MIPTSSSSSSSSSILRKVPSFLRSPILSPTPPSSIRRFRLVQFCPNFSIRNSISISGRVIGGKGFPVSGLRVRQMGMDYTRISAVSDSGSGGIGGSDGGGSGGSGGDGGGGDGGSNPRWSLLSWYLDLLARFPVLTKAVTSGLLTLIGDVVCQLVIDQVPSLDLKRTFVFSFVGLALVGPTLHFWYLFLSKLVTFPGSSGAFLRLLLDQFVFSPVFIGVVLASLVTLEGHPSRVVPKLQQEWFSAVIANWQLWIPFQFLNFRFVPQQFQVLAANFMALIWNVILSYKAHKEIRPQ